MSDESRKYYRAAVDRYGDAQVLLSGNRTTGAVYLAGYAVECALKTLIIAATRPSGRSKAASDFRGKKNHDLEHLRSVYFRKGGPRFPPDIARLFALVNWWNTDLRYDTKRVSTPDAEDFLGATTIILEWVKRRL